MKSTKEFTDLGFKAPKLNEMVKKLVDLCSCQQIAGVQKDEILRLNRRFLSGKLIFASQRSFLNNAYIENVLRKKKVSITPKKENKTQNHIGIVMFNKLKLNQNEKNLSH